MNKLTEYLLKDAESVAHQINPAELVDKTVLITGSTGIIGTYFVSAFVNLINKNKLNTKLIAVTHGKPDDYYRELLNFGGADFINGDLADYDFCQSLSQADYIIHAAGYGQPGKFMDDRVKTLRVNTFTTFVLFEKLNEKGKFLFISTSEVYSGLRGVSYKETEIGTTNTNHPRSCYIEAKRAGEAICNAYRNKGVAAKSARLCLAYGPGTKVGDARVINNFIYKAINKGRLDLLDKGEARRTYCYVTDAVKILWQILLNGQDDIYNVGGRSQITVGDLAKKIGEYLRVPVIFPIDINPMVGAPDDVCLDMSKFEQEFGKTNYMPLEEGLKRTIEWQKILYS